MNLLSFFISLFILIFPYFMWYKLHKELKSYNDIVPYFAHIDKNVPDYILTHDYNSIITPTEQAFFVELAKICNNSSNKYYIFSQVSLLSIIMVNPKKSKYFSFLFESIRSKYVDFVIVDSNFKTKLVIELNDKSHTKFLRKVRDDTLKEILFDVGISFIPVTLGNKYNYLNDIQKILE